MTGKITRKELSPGVRAELDKTGNLPSLETTEKSTLVGAVNSHLVETMPHRFSDNGTIYKYGFKAENGELIFTYEEVL